MSVFPEDVPGIAENATPIPAFTPQAFELESSGEMPSKPYMQALAIGDCGVFHNFFGGYGTARLGMAVSNARVFVTPKIPNSPRTNNAVVPRPSNAHFSGSAPVKGIFTGVSDDFHCR